MAVKLLENSIKTKQAPLANVAIQLLANLVMIYVANKLSIDIWRSIRGH
jgi:hypothetical protein